MDALVHFLQALAIQTVNGVVTGMILALVSSGLTLIFGIMDVVNSPTASCSCSAPIWASWFMPRPEASGWL